VNHWRQLSGAVYVVPQGIWVMRMFHEREVVVPVSSMLRVTELESGGVLMYT